ncbi:E3 ubiquitin-protein ligase KCMF1 [Oryzias melastigma]|uniref:E3 ubiquitin-protein ligase KCMF1 n=1 Tax=Oryzias melastigma TaxID=30732 RepID=A0A834L136_ORYME|nr:E3 ubiquitin-protein ligase KCMF1 [Oryzias melastigma]
MGALTQGVFPTKHHCCAYIHQRPPQGSDTCQPCSPPTTTPGAWHLNNCKQSHAQTFATGSPGFMDLRDPNTSLSWFVKTHPPGGSVQFACTVLTCSIVSVKPMVAVPKQSARKPEQGGCVGIRRMSRHEGVSCDACLKGNFRGRRYKCLICYDYDLCASCYESGATTTRHTTEHPMQCILTRVDFDLYYGGEAFSVEQPQAFTCPYCGRMGYTEISLQEHVAAEHTETSTEVICPICAALPGGDPNHVTDDFAAHLTLEHRAPRDLISFPSFS